MEAKVVSLEQHIEMLELEILKLKEENHLLRDNLKMVNVTLDDYDYDEMDSESEKEDEELSEEDQHVSDSEFEHEISASDQCLLEQSSPTDKVRGRPKHSLSDSDSEDLPQKKRTRKALSIEDVMAVDCNCDNDCLSMLSLDQVKTVREIVDALDSRNKGQWLLDYIWTHSTVSSKGVEMSAVIGDTKVCLIAWLAVTGIPQSTFYLFRSKVKDGIKSVDLPKKRKSTSASENTVAWLNVHAGLYGDTLPNSDKVHLPTCCTRESVYEQMLSEKYPNEVVSLPHFYRLWRTRCDNIVIPKKSRFTKCSVCCKIKAQLLRIRGDTEERRTLLEQRNKHLLKQKCERQKYYKHAMKAKMQPEKYLSLIVDAMDTSKTNIPHLKQETSDSMLAKLGVHLVGCIAHGRGAYGFMDLDEFPHSSNLIITCILKVLGSVRSLPPNLYLQLDNCARENKNRYLIGFLALLVDMGVFAKVKLSFLMSGHTHEDIDQLFSVFSRWLKINEAHTLPQLQAGLEKCYTPSPKVFRTQQVYDVVDWMEKEDILNKISGHSVPHTYKITKDACGGTVIHYKHWSTAKTWEISKGTRGAEGLLRHVPTTIPSLVQPTPPKDVDKKMLDIIREFVSSEDAKWWEDFAVILKKEGSEFTGTAPGEWELSHMSKCHTDSSLESIPEEEEPMVDFKCLV